MHAFLTIVGGRLETQRHQTLCDIPLTDFKFRPASSSQVPVAKEREREPLKRKEMLLFTFANSQNAIAEKSVDTERALRDGVSGYFDIWEIRLSS